MNSRLTETWITFQCVASKSEVVVWWQHWCVFRFQCTERRKQQNSWLFPATLNAACIDDSRNAWGEFSPDQTAQLITPAGTNTCLFLDPVLLLQALGSVMYHRVLLAASLLSACSGRSQFQSSLMLLLWRVFVWKRLNTWACWQQK